MANYGARLNRAAASITLAVGSLENPGSGMRRLKLYDLIFGSEATPADNVFLVEVQRTTTAGTGTAVTPNPLDPADPVAVSLPKETITSQGTETAGEVPLSFALNQRATFRWVAAPGGEIIIPAVANDGLHINTTTALNLPAASCSLNYEEA